MHTGFPNFLRVGSPRPQPRVLLVSPHPDDEVIGAGSRLPLLENVTVVQVTDGSPPGFADAHANGFASREAYASARRSELLDALALAGHRETVHLGLPDQQASFYLTTLAFRLHELIAELRPAIIVTVPYEGGHPDHDATAFAVHAAVNLCPVDSRPQLIEMTAYHNGPNGCTYSSFLDSDGAETTIHLTPEESALKRRMFDCFRTQAHVLKWFPIGPEKFRHSPSYDFRAAPHPGALYYEGFPWGMTGPLWRSLADEALHELNRFAKKHPIHA